MAGLTRRQVAPLAKAEKLLGRNEIAFLFHALCLITYVRVWMWHTTAAAAVLPGSKGFGWFFRYLTFYSYTLQLLQLLLCCLAHVTRKDVKLKRSLMEISDRLSCATFGLANTVTAMFYAIENTTQGCVEGGEIERPPWLDVSVHLANTAVAWVDLLIVEQRSFCGRSRHLAAMLAVVYCAWLLLVRQINGKFPYPFLNKLPFPLGFIGLVATGLVLTLGIFQLGKFVRGLVDGKQGSDGGEAEAAHADGGKHKEE